MAGPSTSFFTFSTEYNGALTDGLTVLLSFNTVSSVATCCSIFHGGSWEHLYSSVGTTACIDKIVLNNGFLNIEARLPDDPMYVCIIPVEGYLTT